MSAIEGRAKKYDGTAIDYVSLFNWTDGKCLAQIKPNTSSKWRYSYYNDEKIGITYISDGCEPITHGPYDIYSSWNPLAFFANNELGIHYDPSDLSSLFQDAAGTTPVTEDGQPVGLIKDLSGNNYHASQSALNSRPIYKTDGVLHWLRFDGVDDYLASEYSLKSSKHLMAIVAHILDTNGQKGIIECFGDAEFASNYKKGSRINYFNNIYYFQQGDGVTRYNTSITATDAKAVFIGRADEKNTEFVVNNQVQSKVQAGVMKPAPRLYIGQNSALTTAAKMDFYGALVLERNTTTDELTKIKSYMSDMAGLIT